MSEEIFLLGLSSYLYLLVKSWVWTIHYHSLVLRLLSSQLRPKAQYMIWTLNPTVDIKRRKKWDIKTLNKCLYHFFFNMKRGNSIKFIKMKGRILKSQVWISVCIIFFFFFNMKRGNSIKFIKNKEEKFKKSRVSPLRQSKYSIHIQISITNSSSIFSSFFLLWT